MRPSIPLALEAAAARAAGSLSRFAGRGGGTTLPGKLLWKLDPAAIDRLAARLPQGSVLVSATNGKTTTTAMAAEILRPRVRLAHNDSGANLVSRRRLHPPHARAAPSSGCSRWTRPRSPSSRVASGRRRCCSATSSATSSTATASSSSSPPAGARPSRRCPRRSSSSTATTRRSATWRRDGRASLTFGIDDPRHARRELQHAADSKYCLRCGTPYVYAAAYVGHLGDYRCPNCGHARPPLDVAAREIELRGLDGSSFTLAAPTRRGAGRAGAARPLQRLQRARRGLAGTRARRSARRRSSAGSERFSAAFGRFERIAIGDRRLLMLLIKNPAGANEAVRTIVDGGAPQRRRDRAQRRDRRRPRRLVDLGRRLRAARSTGSTRSSRPARARPSWRCGSPTAAWRATGSRSCRRSKPRSTAASS